MCEGGGGNKTKDFSPLREVVILLVNQTDVCLFH